MYPVGADDALKFVHAASDHEWQVVNTIVYRPSAHVEARRRPSERCGSSLGLGATQRADGDARTPASDLWLEESRHHETSNLDHHS